MKKLIGAPIYTDRKVVVETSKALLRSNHFKVLIPFLVWVSFGLVHVGETHAQISPDGRDRTYKQAAPSRFDRRFGSQPRPKSKVVPVKPKSMAPSFPDELEEVKFVLKRLFIKGTTIYDKRDLKSIYKKFLRKELTLRQIYEIAQQITNKYRNDGYILSKAIVPPQKIHDGAVHIQIIEGYIDKVKIQGPVRGPKKLLNAYRKKILKSRPLRSLVLERYLLLIDDLPGVTAKSVLKPSEVNPGATSLTLVLTDKAFEGYVATDNRGSEFNGPYEYSSGVTANSLLGGYGRTGITGVVTSQTEELFFLNAFYDLPVSRWGVAYNFADEYGGINLLRFNLGQGLNMFDATEPGSSNLSRTLGKSNFTKLTGDVMRLQNLAPGWALLGVASWQYSFDKLLESEEFGVGGAQYGRAYDSSEITGDQGLAFKVELQKELRPEWEHLSDLQLYGFVDYGAVWNKVKTSTGAKNQSRTSMGLGMRFNLTDSISGHAELDKPISDNVAAEGNKDPRLFFSLSKKF